MQQFHRPGVDVEVELKTKAQQDIGGMLIRRHARVAERAEENGVKLLAKHSDGARRE